MRSRWRRRSRRSPRGSASALVYKTSFDKANRTSAGSARGIGLDEALPIFAEIRANLGLPVLTDVHESEQCAAAAEAVDVLQNPGLPVPPDRPSGRRRAAPARSSTSRRASSSRPGTWRTWSPRSPAPAMPNVLVTERGVSFGYNTLVSDMRALPILARHRRAGDLRRHPFGAAARRARHRLGRRARVRAGAGARRGRGRRRRRCSSRPIRIPTARRPTVPTWCRCGRWKICCAG